MARGVEGLEAARTEIEALGGRALVLPADVADAEAVETAAAAVEDELGPLDVWVNCAMLSVLSPVKELEPDEARRVTEVTYLGYVYGTLAALRRMLPRDRGTIVQVGSALAYRAIPLQALYCGAKHAVHGFTASLRTELLHDRSRVRVTEVQLPAVNTPQFDVVKSRLPRRPQPVPPIYQPEVAAEAIVWAAERAPSETYVATSSTKAIVGERLAPRLLDRYLARTGFESQQTDEPVAPDRPHNLWEPPPGDRGAHGRFHGEARSTSVQLWGAKHRFPLGVAGAAAATGAVAARAFRRRSRAARPRGSAH